MRCVATVYVQSLEQDKVNLYLSEALVEETNLYRRCKNKLVKTTFLKVGFVTRQFKVFEMLFGTFVKQVVLEMSSI